MKVYAVIGKFVHDNDKKHDDDCDECDKLKLRLYKDEKDAYIICAGSQYEEIITYTAFTPNNLPNKEDSLQDWKRYLEYLYQCIGTESRNLYHYSIVERKVL